MKYRQKASRFQVIYSSTASALFSLKLSYLIFKLHKTTADDIYATAPAMDSGQ